MKRSVFLTLALFMLAVLNMPAFGQRSGGDAAFPRLEPDPRAQEFFLRGAQNEGFSWQDLAEISVWASDGGSQAVRRIHSLRNLIAANPGLPADQMEKADFILGYLHSSVLRGYSLDQSRIDTLFSTGRFNCVSSAVLYMILVSSFGIEVSGVMTVDHAFVTVHIDGQDIDVETTSAFGFNPGNRREFHDEFGRVTGLVYVPAGNYHDRETISRIELVSLIMTNRIAELEAARRFAEAVPIAVDRAALLTGSGGRAARDYSAASFFQDPRGDLMDRLFNLGAFLLNSRREEEALRWFDTASARYPYQAGRWQELALASVNNRVTRFVQGGQFGYARAFLDAHGWRLAAESFAALDAALLDNELAVMANGIQNAAGGEAAISAIEAAFASGRLDRPRAQQMLTFAIQRTASVISAEGGGDWLAGINFIEASQRRFGSNADLERALQTFRDNRAAYFHNRFAEQWNSGNFDAARLVLAEALAEFPTNSQLLSNLEIVERHR